MKIYDIMLDMDDVMIPTIDSIHELAFKAGLHDGSVLPAWRGWEVYGCEEDIYWALWSEFATSGGYLHTPPIPGAAEGARRLAWEGHRIHIVTARGFMNHAEEIREWTPQWLEEFAFPHETLTFAQDKPAAMREILRSFNKGVFDYALDDSPKNFILLREAGVKVYLQDHPHNRDFEVCAHPAGERVSSLMQFADIILQEEA